ncbi:Uncharacterised protein [Chlamydia trachomatis]|nr:Uncharacterised protein [Chlamydia trachomatis]CRI74707.1 Uncharacterised protein [Chlamydia trachomatis]
MRIPAPVKKIWKPSQKVLEVFEQRFPSVGGIDYQKKGSLLELGTFLQSEFPARQSREEGK